MNIKQNEINNIKVYQNNILVQEFKEVENLSFFDQAKINFSFSEEGKRVNKTLIVYGCYVEITKEV